MSRDREAYLALLEARLRGLVAVAEGRGQWPRVSRPERTLARRVLRKLEGAWDDGDENLVRGFLDKWLGPAEEPAVAAARSLLSAAAALAPIRSRPGTLYFLLWEMESMLTSSGEIARIPAQSSVNRSGPGGC
jgi:hypothetical protein